MDYTSAKYAFLGVVLIVLNACNFDTKKNESVTASVPVQSSNQQNPPKTAQDDFNLTDTTLKTIVGKPIKLCLDIDTKSANPSFTIATTKAPLYGKLTPSVVGKKLCFDYVPNATFDGLDQFDCKVCMTSSGFCEEKTWYVEVKKETTKPQAQPTVSSSTPKIVKKKEEVKIETPPPVIPSRSTIFDPDKKNNDGYVPKNEN